VDWIRVPQGPVVGFDQWSADEYGMKLRPSAVAGCACSCDVSSDTIRLRHCFESAAASFPSVSA
jgi:hypothetical protein